MKNIFAVFVLMTSLTSVSNASSETGEYISQLGYATSMAPVVIVMSPFAPTILGLASTFSPDKIARKMIIEAQEDAAYFVASEGEIRTARFDQVVRLLRVNAEAVELSDFELAQIALVIGAQ